MRLSPCQRCGGDGNPLLGSLVLVDQPLQLGGTPSHRAQAPAQTLWQAAGLWSPGTVPAAGVKGPQPETRIRCARIIPICSAAAPRDGPAGLGHPRPPSRSSRGSEAGSRGQSNALEKVMWTRRALSARAARDVAAEHVRSWYRNRERACAVPLGVHTARSAAAWREYGECWCPQQAFHWEMSARR